MSSKAQAGRGTVVSIGGGPVGSSQASTYTKMGELATFPLKAPKWQFEDTTNFDSASDAEYLATIRADGSVTLTMNRVTGDPGQVLVQGAAGSGQLYPFKVVLPLNPLAAVPQTTKGDEYDFNAFVLSTGDIDIAPTKKIGLSIDLKISGPVTFTAGS